MTAGKRNKLIEIQHRTDVQEDVYGTETISWSKFTTAWAEVQDMLPSRAERLLEGLDIAKRPCRIRMLYRNDIDSTMRVKIGDRYLRIVSPPVEMGFNEEIEFLAEQYTTEGQEP